jgi:Helix-hairpin-helix motif
MRRLLQVICLVCVVAVGCSNKPQERQTHTGDTTREMVARATQRFKPELKWSAHKLGQAVEWTAEETLAAMEGFIEGWLRPSTAHVNVNSANVRQLETLPGVTPDDAHRIVRDRPYRNKRELVQKGAITESAYARIKEQITTD